MECVSRGVLSGLVLLACVVGASDARAINKCVGADGRVSFQDGPCPGKGEAITVRPASGAAPLPAVPASGGIDAALPPPQKRVAKEGAFGETWQRRTYLENHGVPDARAAVHGHKLACERKLAELAVQKRTANNNLAGAMYLQSISAEMQSAATMCDMRSRELSADLQVKEAELRRLQAAGSR